MTEKKEHEDVDRRFSHRRKGRERREEMRWEPDKEDRRHGKGRRKEDIENDMWRS
ncbi:hypothetical protein PVT67_06320 [Gallaecimonas kandeliae]|uniref:hypothetical protein n=1 Tax=Gallaecimonas kandeliae TaxID=3029055 RepID=UPI0026497FE6|nr:hypothetical protein [Gallaecimonas kandeliae]WKE66848.1 hypothetical protein PVT67_06320 [Gallaecimonas kandeliae]